jgi:hypothetical protein
MSVDERELRLRLDSELETITPPPAPVAVTVRKGRTMRTRRRIGVAVGLAAAVGIALAAPSLVHQIVRQSLETKPNKPVLTVYPPDPGAPRGEIAWGTINGKRWDINVTSSSGPQGQCMQIDHGTPSCGPPMKASQDPSDTVTFEGSSDNRVTYQAGVVQPDVTRLVIALANGTKLTLHPRPLYGQRWVAFALPTGLRIANGTAYSKQSELAYAIPYGNSSFVTWLRPGEQGLPRATRLLGSGVVNGAAWSDVLHVGPWGYCSTITLFGGASDWCQPARSRVVAGNFPKSSVGTPPSGAVIEGYASPSVAYVVGILSDGRTIRARAVDVGGQKFWACAVSRGQLLRRVMFYSASGRQITAQSGARYS